MSFFGNLFKKAASSIAPTITGFLAGGPMGAGAAFAGSMLMPRASGPSAPAQLVSPQIPFGVNYGVQRARQGATPVLGSPRQRLTGGPLMLPSHTPGSVGFDPSLSGLPNLGVYQLPPANRSLSPQEAQDFYMRTGGLAPRGYHITRTGMMVRNRHMNVLNPRALNRALRRAHGFARYAKRVIRVVERPSGHRFKMGKRRRRAA